mmetsp:Transcript_2991/g.8335  ORF Transcript_2991/g.8335 Transcript_2991/m.8335 type:complete len:319 (+) Transcript_2991:1108-2064(+)
MLRPVRTMEGVGKAMGEPLRYGCTHGSCAPPRVHRMMCGGSSGAAMHAALLAARRLGKGKRCVVLLPDSTRNYMSKLLDDDWLVAHGFETEPVPDRYGYHMGTSVPRGGSSPTVIHDRGNEMDCAQLAWSFMRTLKSPDDKAMESPPARPGTPHPSASTYVPPRLDAAARSAVSGSDMGSSNELACNQLAWAFMKQPSQPKPKATSYVPPWSSSSGLERGNSLDCAQLAWSFMKPRASRKPPAAMHYASPQLKIAEPASLPMPKIDLSALMTTAADDASGQATRLASPYVTAVGGSPCKGKAEAQEPMPPMNLPSSLG